MNINKKKKLTAGLSITSNIILTILKIIAGTITGSISIISEAIHSASDLFASAITFFSVSKSAKPADSDHPYGHGKYEDMSGFIEGLLIIFASFFIIFEASRKIITGHNLDIENPISIVVMFISVIVNCLISSLLLKVAKESNSISLYADGQHLKTDIYSSIGVLIGLILIKTTGHHLLDPIIAILVAVIIYRTGYSIAKNSLKNLLDHSLPNEDIEKIKETIGKFHNIKLKENSIKARQTGPSKDIFLTLQFNGKTPICECHKICDEVEKELQTIFSDSTISIHSEPICYETCNNCSN